MHIHNHHHYFINKKETATLQHLTVAPVSSSNPHIYSHFRDKYHELPITSCTLAQVNPRKINFDETETATPSTGERKKTQSAKLIGTVARLLPHPINPLYKTSIPP
jgi:hypothetical protein